MTVSPGTLYILLYFVQTIFITHTILFIKVSSTGTMISKANLSQASSVAMASHKVNSVLHLPVYTKYYNT